MLVVLSGHRQGLIACADQGTTNGDTATSCVRFGYQVLNHGQDMFKNTSIIGSHSRIGF